MYRFLLSPFRSSGYFHNRKACLTGGQDSDQYLLFRGSGTHIEVLEAVPGFHLTEKEFLHNKEIFVPEEYVGKRYKVYHIISADRTTYPSARRILKIAVNFLPE